MGKNQSAHCYVRVVYFPFRFRNKFRSHPARNRFPFNISNDESIFFHVFINLSKNIRKTLICLTAIVRAVSGTFHCNLSCLRFIHRASWAINHNLSSVQYDRALVLVCRLCKFNAMYPRQYGKKAGQ